MRDPILLLVHVVATILRVVQPGGVRAVVAESVLIKHQLLILNRRRRRAPNLHMVDRLIAGFCSLWIMSNRFRRVAIAFKPSTLLMVVMDQYTRRIIGFGIHVGAVDGLALCRIFLQAIRGAGLPKYLSSDHDPLYRFHQWEANLRILGVMEIKTVPYAPWSHPFIERLIGTIQRECSNRTLFWTAADLEIKLIAFRDYYNG
jgi:transposase InsO family protein